MCKWMNIEVRMSVGPAPGGLRWKFVASPSTGAGLSQFSFAQIEEHIIEADRRSFFTEGWNMYIKK